MNIYQEKIYNHLLKSITEGKLPRNKRIPTEIELSNMFGTNRMNAHFAVKELERFGVLRRNKGQGTFVNKIPSPVTTGELKSVNTRRVCVLNHNAPTISKIHWNERVVKTFENKMCENNIETIFEDISRLTTKDEFSEAIKNITAKGYNSLVLVNDDFSDNIIQAYPETVFKFHNNVFIFDRGRSMLHEWPYNVVTVNLFREGVMVAEYLLKQGYENIIYSKSERDYYWVNERARGLQFGLLRESEGKIRADILDIRDETLLDIIENSSKKYAVVAKNDEAAAIISEYALKRGLKAGKDFGLIGFDDNINFRDFNLTTVSPPLEKIGEKLAELVVNSFNGKANDEIATIRIDSELIIGKTC
jgi:DNA-binding LacI/PurR family transcriptional regulator